MLKYFRVCYLLGKDKSHGLLQACQCCRLLQEDVTSLEDVYWLEDSRARYLLGKDFAVWSVARQALPVNKEDLGKLKAELWSTVVKSSQHQDAWTFGQSFLPLFIF